MNKIVFKDHEIVLNRELSDLDRFVLEGIPLIAEVFPRYVIIVDYIAILFGRSRTTEDIDTIVDPSEINIYIVYSKTNKHYKTQQLSYKIRNTPPTS